MFKPAKLEPTSGSCVLPVRSSVKATPGPSPQQLAKSHVKVSAAMALWTHWVALCAVGCAALLLAGAGQLARGQSVAEAPQAVTLHEAGPEPDLSRYVSPNLESSEWALMNAVMKSLPLAMREEIASKSPESVSFAVVEGGTGKIHYNRPEDVGGYEVIADDKPLPGDEHPFAGRLTRTAARGFGHAGTGDSDRTDSEDAHSETTNPGVYSGSGPYRRIYTEPVVAAPLGYTVYDSDYILDYYYKQGGVVTIDCVAGNLPVGSGDIGYSYLGGWSGNWSAYPKYSAVDAGLQYNRGASEASDDDYSLFLKLSGETIISRGNGKSGIDGSAGLPVPPHLKCSNIAPVALTFGVVGAGQLRSVAPECWDGSTSNPHFKGFPIESCNTYALFVAAESVQFIGSVGNVHTNYIVWVAPNVSDGGWAKLVPYVAGWDGDKLEKGFVVDATCGGCMFKWMTSIAQKKQNLTDGSSFSATWKTHEISDYALKGDKNTLVSLGAALANCSEFPLWTPPYSSNYKADCKNSPVPTKKGAAPPPVVVTGYKTGSETDTIDLQ